MISVLTGITKNFVGALLTRLFLGWVLLINLTAWNDVDSAVSMVEAAFLPGALFLLR